LRWLLLLEEYGVTFKYLPGKIQKNNDVIADALERKIKIIVLLRMLYPVLTLIA
jgi:VanZ family protein